MRRRKLHHLLSLANHPIRPFQMVWPLSVAQGEREEQPLHERKVALHPLLDTALSELKGGGVLRIRQRRACVYVAGELVQDDDECEPSAWRVGPPVKLPPPGLFEEWGEQLGYLSIDLWSSLKPAQNLLPEGFGIGIVAWGEPVREDLLGVDDRPRLAHSASFFSSLCLPYFNAVCNLGSCQICSTQERSGLPYYLYSPSYREEFFSETAETFQTALGLCAMMRTGGDTRKLGGGFRATGGPAYRLRRGPDHPRRRGSAL